MSPRPVRLALVAMAILHPHPTPSAAQIISVGDPFEEYLRVLQVAGGDVRGSFTVRPFLRYQDPAGVTGVEDPWGLAARLGPRRPVAGEVWIGGVGAEALFHVNSTFPMGQNDGAVWQGKGLTTVVSGGGTVGFGSLEITVTPLAFLAQNAAFDLALPERPGDAALRYPWSDGIDAPQRFGTDAYFRVDPGESAVRVALRGVRLAVGTESLWWGPGIRNAIVLSNNAGGFLHASLGSNGPVDIGIGTLEAQWIWGRLAHSDWWDESRTDRNRFLTGAVLAYSPRWLPGLSVGSTRVFTRLIPEDGLSGSDYLLALRGVEKEDFSTPDNPAGDDEYDQLGSLFARWVVPGMEVYGEWARNDHAWDFRDLFVQLGHSEAFTLGLRRVVTLEKGRLLSLVGELSHLERSSTSQVRDVPTYYTNYVVVQGYTSRGQILGAWIGPGGNVQYLGADLYDRLGRIGAFVQRRVHNNDAFYAQADSDHLNNNHVSLDLGADASILTNIGEMGLGFTVTKDFNRYFIPDNDVWNANVAASVRWRMR